MKLTDSVSSIKNIGDKREQLLNRLGIYTISDLLTHYPRDYQDRRDIQTVAQAQALEPGRWVSLRVRFRDFVDVPGIMPRITATAYDKTAELSVVWFASAYVKKALVYGEFLLWGKLTRTNRGLAVINPETEPYADNLIQLMTIVPIYPLTQGISQNQLRKIISQALGLSSEFSEYLPDSLRSKYDLVDIKKAVSDIHFPQNPEEFVNARRRLVFDELFLVQMALVKIKGYIKRPTDVVIKDTDLGPLLERLPFSPTDAQMRAFNETLDDMTTGHAANRLIQGDVGCGKTLVAQMLCYLTVKNGFQAAVMAPTQVLAAQHYQSFSSLLEPLGIKVRLLSGQLGSKSKARRQEIASGEADVVVGTHALITDKTKFSRLGLVITDEQHRFGVLARAKLSQKANAPHTLVMSATPIPRTLGLILYGDLDISIIDQLPPGRQKIKTYGVTSAYRDRLVAFMNREIGEGSQVYVICPIIEEGQGAFAGRESVTAYGDMLKKRIKGRVEILHGRMAAAKKDEIMAGFARGDINVLVSTTVIEVGVNVPNATLMIVENAETFGLAQLHQLRGRVGRGRKQSYCVLVSDGKSDITKQRLEAMCQTEDGFEIAEMDIKLRGYGEFFGTAQHGLPDMRIANLYRDLDILESAKQAAADMAEGVRYPMLEQRVNAQIKAFSRLSI